MTSQQWENSRWKKFPYRSWRLPHSHSRLFLVFYNILCSSPGTRVGPSARPSVTLLFDYLFRMTCLKHVTLIVYMLTSWTSSCRYEFYIPTRPRPFSDVEARVPSLDARTWSSWARKAYQSEEVEMSVRTLWRLEALQGLVLRTTWMKWQLQSTFWDAAFNDGATNKLYQFWWHRTTFLTLEFLFEPSLNWGEEFLLKSPLPLLRQDVTQLLPV